MKFTYDSEADAAYLQIVENIAAGEASRQVQVPEDEDIPGQFILDFNEEGKLLRVEILFASTVLPSEMIKN